jgi:hypothetical protein
MSVGQEAELWNGGRVTEVQGRSRADWMDRREIAWSDLSGRSGPSKSLGRQLNHL